MNLNVGTGYLSMSTPLPLDVNVQADFDRSLRGVDVYCDLTHLPFKDDAFNKVYCFHVLEHLDNPVEGLKELIRVCTDIVELEVPHRLGRSASDHLPVGRRKGHVSSFGCMWFHKCLKQFAYCLRVPWDFPRHIAIHVWIYPHLHSKRSPI